MILKQRLLKDAIDKAVSALAAYQKKSGGSDGALSDLLGRPELDASLDVRTTRATIFAERLCQVGMAPQSSFPGKPGFSSWLIVYWPSRDGHNFGIALSREELAKDGEIPLDCRKARTILHEVAHVLHLERSLPQRDAPAPPVEPIDENMAWVTALVLYGAAAGARAQHIRENHDIDDTPGVAF